VLSHADAMCNPVASEPVRAALHRTRRACLSLALLLLPAVTVSQVVGVVPMHEDHRAILISGYARGATEDPSIISIVINGIDFVVNMMPSSGITRHEFGSPIGTCKALQEQIADFTLGVKAIPEFEAACIALAGDAALLLVQANAKKYLVPSAQVEDDEAVRWIRAKRRFVFVSVNTTDQSQKITVVK